MKTWQKVLIPTLITLAIGVIYLFSVWKQRQNPGVIGQNDTSQPVAKDDLVVMRAFFPAHIEDLQRLVGTTVWMKNGYTISYFFYAGGTVQFGKQAGVVPSLERLEVKKIVKAAVPSKVDDGVGYGDHQVFAIFTLPGNTVLYALPVGTMQDGEEGYYTDALFFYDDPHTIYNYWPKGVWTAIDAHQVIPGMSELETRMAVGQKMQGGGGSKGDRSATYDQAGKQWTVTFANDKATAVKTQ